MVSFEDSNCSQRLNWGFFESNIECFYSFLYLRLCIGRTLVYDKEILRLQVDKIQHVLYELPNFYGRLVTEEWSGTEVRGLVHHVIHVVITLKHGVYLRSVVESEFLRSHSKSETQGVEPSSALILHSRIFSRDWTVFLLSEEPFIRRKCIWSAFTERWPKVWWSALSSFWV